MLFAEQGQASNRSSDNVANRWNSAYLMEHRSSGEPNDDDERMACYFEGDKGQGGLITFVTRVAVDEIPHDELAYESVGEQGKHFVHIGNDLRSVQCRHRRFQKL